MAYETTGLGLSTLILNKRGELNIPFDDCRGQSYVNGANMKGRNRGVQARLLEKNPCVIHVPCGAHSLNLVVADAAKASTDAINYFGNVQKLYIHFSAAPQRWATLKEHMTVALKSWSDTRWESHINSIEAVRYQTSKIRDVLLEVKDKVTDPPTKVEAQILAEEIGSYRFLICTVVWYDCRYAQSMLAMRKGRTLSASQSMAHSKYNLHKEQNSSTTSSGLAISSE